MTVCRWCRSGCVARVTLACVPMPSSYAADPAIARDRLRLVAPGAGPGQSGEPRPVRLCAGTSPVRRADRGVASARRVADRSKRRASDVVRERATPVALVASVRRGRAVAKIAPLESPTPGRCDVGEVSGGSKAAPISARAFNRLPWTADKGRLTSPEHARTSRGVRRLDGCGASASRKVRAPRKHGAG